jgi:hypothetical protein
MIASMKNSNYTIGNQTRHLPTCSAVPQPTALPRAPGHVQCLVKKELGFLSHPEFTYSEKGGTLFSGRYK